MLYSAIIIQAQDSGSDFNDKIEYRTFIYTSSTLDEDIQRENAKLIEFSETQNDTRGSFGSDLLSATLNAGKNMASGYITSFIDLGVNAIAALATRNQRLHDEWKNTVEKENSWTTSISTVDEIKDFYAVTSKDGALDPAGMKFDGIGCLRKEGEDTVFFISCHIDRSKLYRIINHSKFELILDSLIINPYRSNIPNSTLPVPFSYEQRKDFMLSMKINLMSSWYTELIDLHYEEPLGEFIIDIPVEEDELDGTGCLRYFRKTDEAPKYNIVGESFIVPRSFNGYRDKFGKYRRIWGTGQYKIEVTLSESCKTTEYYEKNWKKDYRLRKSLQPKQNVINNIWKTISNQKWDEIGQKWIITTLSAPADVVSDKIIETLDLSDSKTRTNPSK